MKRANKAKKVENSKYIVETSKDVKSKLNFEWKTVLIYELFCILIPFCSAAY